MLDIVGKKGTSRELSSSGGSAGISVLMYMEIISRMIVAKRIYGEMNFLYQSRKFFISPCINSVKIFIFFIIENFAKLLHNSKI